MTFLTIVSLPLPPSTPSNVVCLGVTPWMVSASAVRPPVTLSVNSSEEKLCYMTERSTSLNGTLLFLPRCIECRAVQSREKSLSVRPSVVCLSVKRVNCDKTEKNVQIFLHHTNEHLA